jgi:hypothetical protein
MRLEEELVWPVLEIFLGIHELLAMGLHRRNRTTRRLHRGTEGRTLSWTHGHCMLLLPLAPNPKFILSSELILPNQLSILIILWPLISSSVLLHTIVHLVLSILSIGLLIVPVACSVSHRVVHGFLYLATNSTHQQLVRDSFMSFSFFMQLSLVVIFKVRLLQPDQMIRGEFTHLWCLLILFPLLFTNHLLCVIFLTRLFLVQAVCMGFKCS